MPSISIVDADGTVLPVKEANYHDVGDASGDIDGGDFWGYVWDQYPQAKVKEIRIIMEEPITSKDFEEPDFEEPDDDDDD